MFRARDRTPRPARLPLDKVVSREVLEVAVGAGTSNERSVPLVPGPLSARPSRLPLGARRGAGEGGCHDGVRPPPVPSKPGGLRPRPPEPGRFPSRKPKDSFYNLIIFISFTAAALPAGPGRSSPTE